MTSHHIWGNPNDRRTHLRCWAYRSRHEKLEYFFRNLQVTMFNLRFSSAAISAQKIISTIVPVLYHRGSVGWVWKEILFVCLKRNTCAAIFLQLKQQRKIESKRILLFNTRSSSLDTLVTKSYDVMIEKLKHEKSLKLLYN